jgi:hypothetical protein
MITKNVGIIADNFKLGKFKKELDTTGFKYEIVSMPLEISNIKILDVPIERVDDIKKICHKVETHFKRGN